jgi:hypothetical protein
MLTLSVGENLLVALSYPFELWSMPRPAVDPRALVFGRLLCDRGFMLPMFAIPSVPFPAFAVWA